MDDEVVEVKRWYDVNFIKDKPKAPTFLTAEEIIKLVEAKKAKSNQKDSET